MTTSRRFLLSSAVLVAAVAVIAAPLVADAARLDISANNVSTDDVAHPCPGTTSAEPAERRSGSNYWSVTLTFPPGCANRPVHVVMDAAGARDDRSGSGQTNAAGVATIRFGSTYSTNTDYAFHSAADGWEMALTGWTADVTPPIWCTVVSGGAPGVTCTASLTVRSGYYDVVVATTSSTPVVWEVGFDLAHPVYGGVPARLGNSDLDGYDDGVTQWARDWDDYRPPNDVTGGASCAARPALAVRGIDSYGAGHPENNFRTVVAGRDREFSLRVGSTNPDYWDILDC